MKIDKSQVSGSRFMFALTFFLQSSALLTSFLACITKQESWLPVVFGAVFCIPLVYLYRTLMVMFPDKNLLQVLEEVYGRVAGKVLGASYIWFFLTLSSLNLIDLGNFAKITVMTETPHLVLTLTCVLVAVWAVRNGFKVVARYGSLFTVIEFIIVGVSIILLVNQINFKNFLPIFDQPVMKYVQSTHIISTIPLGELVVFLMVTPCVKLSRRQITKHWFLGVGMGILTMLVVLLRDISILGNTLHLFALPGLVTLRLVNLGEALSRMEILFALGLMMLLFFKVAVLSYVSTVAIAQLVGTTAYKSLALVTGILILVYSMTIYPNSVAQAASAREITPAVWTLFEMILPLLTFILAKIRKLPKASKKAEAKGEEA